ncbi:ROK family protein [Gryllotalpicola reticulitermitis]|uniref:ROK family protein n=1 Tax=Gryllotalpicola reticulitermitis TaxID=1184153 RepID=A0ABV8QAB7_9MICO
MAIAPTLLRTMNQRFLLDWLYKNGAATRPQLARDSGLSQPTVFATLANLVEAGLVRPSGQSDEPAGRPALVYEADPTAGSVLAVDLGVGAIRVVAADLLGTQLSRIERPNRARNVKPLVEAVRSAAAEAAERAGLDLGQFSAAVIAVPGVYEPGQDRLSYAPHMPGSRQSGLSRALSDGLGLPTTLENSVNLAALSEYTEGAGRGVSPFAYLHIETGVGMGLIIDGELYRGANGAAGEVGFLPFGPPRDAATIREEGLLERALADEALVAYAHEAGMAGELTAAEIYAAARAGDEAAVRAVGRQSDMLATLIASISAVLDPELVVLGGRVGRNLDLLGDGLSDRLAALTPLRTRLAVSSLGRDAAVRGAVVRGVTLAREAEFTARMRPATVPSEAAQEIS